MHSALSQRVSVLGETLIIPCVSENYAMCHRHNWHLNREDRKSTNLWLPKGKCVRQDKLEVSE